MKVNNKGITLVALVITIVIMLILAGITIYIGVDILQRARIEDIRTNMLMIQTPARISYERNSFGEGELHGTVPTGEIAIPQAIRDELIRVDNEYNYKIVLESDLEEMGLAHISIDPERGEFYVIDYNNNAEIFYSLGIECRDDIRRHSLSDFETYL